MPMGFHMQMAGVGRRVCGCIAFLVSPQGPQENSDFCSTYTHITEFQQDAK